MFEKKVGKNDDSDNVIQLHDIESFVHNVSWSYTKGCEKKVCRVIQSVYLATSSSQPLIHQPLPALKFGAVG